MYRLSLCWANWSIQLGGGGGLPLLDGINPGGETDCESEVSKYPQCNDYGRGHFVVFSAMTPARTLWWGSLVCDH